MIATTALTACAAAPGSAGTAGSVARTAPRAERALPRTALRRGRWTTARDRACGAAGVVAWAAVAVRAGRTAFRATTWAAALPTELLLAEGLSTRTEALTILAGRAGYGTAANGAAAGRCAIGTETLPVLAACPFHRAWITALSAVPVIRLGIGTPVNVSEGAAVGKVRGTAVTAAACCPVRTVRDAYAPFAALSHLLTAQRPSVPADGAEGILAHPSAAFAGRTLIRPNAVTISIAAQACLLAVHELVILANSAGRNLNADAPVTTCVGVTALRRYAGAIAVATHRRLRLRAFHGSAVLAGGAFQSSRAQAAAARSVRTLIRRDAVSVCIAA